MSKIKLKPCPFCGERQSVYVTHKETWGDECFYEGFVGCENCDIVLRTGEVYDGWLVAENAAVEKWNRRVDDED